MYRSHWSQEYIFQTQTLYLNVWISYHSPQEHYTNAAQSHQGERDRGPDLEAAGRGSSFREPQRELQGEAPAQGEAGREGQTGEEEKDSLLEVACCIDFVQASFHQSKPTNRLLNPTIDQLDSIQVSPLQ